MEHCAEYAYFQLMNGNARVKHLLDAILCNHAGLKPAIAMLRNIQGTNGIISKFESVSSCLLHYDPVAKRRSSGDKRNHIDVSESMSLLEISSSSVVPKSFVGKTLFYSRFYENDEHCKISKAKKGRYFCLCTISQ